MSFLKCRFRFLKPNFNRERAGRSGAEELPDEPAWFTNVSFLLDRYFRTGPYSLLSRFIPCTDLCQP
jgi:hypothetical protein